MTLNVSLPVSSPQAEGTKVQATPTGATAPEPQVKTQALSEKPAEQANQQDHTNPTSQQPQSQVVLSYHVDPQSKQLYFQVVDQNSGEVIRQVPPEEMLTFERRVSELLQQEQSKGQKTQG